MTMEAPGDDTMMLSEYHMSVRIKRLATMMTEDEHDPATLATMTENLEPIDTGTRRSGRPRINWLEKNEN